MRDSLFRNRWKSESVTAESRSSSCFSVEPIDLVCTTAIFVKPAFEKPLERSRQRAKKTMKTPPWQRHSLGPISYPVDALSSLRPIRSVSSYGCFALSKRSLM
jgi:hypothetical protein